MSQIIDYYNEFDPFAAKWLRKLFPAAEIDRRSIEYVEPEDLAGKRRAHFFAGIGGWELALRLAEWPEDEAVWTGSCPCQPFSVAGSREGFDDERNLWPEWFRLIRECRPQCILGEQVADAIGHGWLDGVFADLEDEGYACGAVVLGAHSSGAPHIRHRVFWVAQSSSLRSSGRSGNNRDQESQRGGWSGSSIGCETDRVANAEREGLLPGTHGRLHSGQEGTGARDGNSLGRGEVCGMADANGGNASHSNLQRSREQRQQSQDGGVVFGVGDSESGGLGINGSTSGSCGHPNEPSQAIGLADTSGSEFRRGSESSGEHGGALHITDRSGIDHVPACHWGDFSVIECSDGKSRRIPPIESGVFPLADGVPNRVGRLRGYGNAIVPQVAAMFIRAYRDSL